MIDRYLERGHMYVLEDNGVKGVCVVAAGEDGVLEIKNIAVDSEFQHMGYGRKMLECIEKTYKDNFKTMLAGTGESPLTIPFYEKCGFVRSHRIKNFFVDNYDKPIFEGGKQLVDMIYFSKNL